MDTDHVNLLSDRFEVLTADGFKSFHGIRASSEKRPTVIIRTDSASVRCTPDHKILTRDGWKPAEDLMVGDELPILDHVEIVRSINKSEADFVYDLLEVEDVNSYLVNDGITVSNCVYLDEFAFVPENIAEEFFASVYPTISSGTESRMLITSTPNGMNLFHDIWKGAEEKTNSFVPIDVHWSEKPGRDEAWAAQEIANIGQEKFDAEYGCQFLAAENSLFSPHTLSRIKVLNPEKISGLDVYERPVDGHRYIITVDTAEGVGQDYSVYSVFDVTSMPYRHVAKFRSKEVSPVHLPINLVNTARSYNDAYVLIEAATVGYQVGYALWSDYDYPYIFTAVKEGDDTKLKLGWSKGHVGVKMTTRVKNTGCANLKGLVESNQLQINDADFIKEASNFTFQNTTFKAIKGHHDDLMMTFVLFGWLAKQSDFINITNTNFKVTKDVDEDRLVPFVTGVNPHEKTIIEDGLVWEIVEGGFGQMGF